SVGAALSACWPWGRRCQRVANCRSTGTEYRTVSNGSRGGREERDISRQTLKRDSEYSRPAVPAGSIPASAAIHFEHDEEYPEEDYPGLVPGSRNCPAPCSPAPVLLPGRRKRPGTWTLRFPPPI